MSEKIITKLFDITKEKIPKPNYNRGLKDIDLNQYPKELILKRFTEKNRLWYDYKNGENYLVVERKAKNYWLLMFMQKDVQRVPNHSIFKTLNKAVKFLESLGFKVKIEGD